MERVNRILNHSLFQECLRQIGEAEQERIFCKHDMRHFLDTARLAWIANLEKGLGLDKEMIYAAALLHDIGRAKQYACGMSHDAASVELIRHIMPECGFSLDEADEVAAAVDGHCQSGGKPESRGCEAVDGHRSSRSTGKADTGQNCQGCGKKEAFHRESGRTIARKNLGMVLREADNASRNCFLCGARESCYWTEERKNLFLRG